MIYILARAHVNKKINSLDMHTSWSATFRQIRVLIESRNLPKMEPTYISLHSKSTCLSVEYNILIKKNNVTPLLVIEVAVCWGLSIFPVSLRCFLI